MEDTRTKEQKEADDQMMKDCYASLDKYYDELNSHNNKILDALGKTAHKDFKNLLDGSNVTDKIDFVKKPSGEPQGENCGIFKNIWVDQSSVGDSGDSYAGYIYGEISKNKWLRVPYEC